MTYCYLDLDHSLQSGMPFLLRDSDYDVREPDTAVQFWPNYEQRRYSAMPDWARVIHLSHSDKASVSAADLSNLQQRLEELTLPPVAAPNSADPVSFGTAYGIPAAIQRAVFDCCNYRMIGVLHLPFSDHPDAEIRYSAQHALLKSGQAILGYQAQLFTLISKSAPSARGAWTQFVFALLRCNFYVAVCILLKLSQHRPEPTINTQRPLVERLNLDIPTLFSTLYTSLKLMEQGYPWSPRSAKELMILSALTRGLEERLRICGELGVQDVDINAPEATPMITAMQRAMEEVVEKSKIAIEEAKKMDDPPPGLCEDGGGPDSAVAVDSRSSLEPAATDQAPGMADGLALVSPNLASSLGVTCVD